MKSLHRKIWESGQYRITEHWDHDTDIESLKGDIYKPELIKEMGYVGTVEELRAEELEFERQVESNGVFGYVLEKWNAEVGKGWTHVDSCWGFVGEYNEHNQDFNHYVVAELIDVARKGES